MVQHAREQLFHAGQHVRGVSLVHPVADELVERRLGLVSLRDGSTTPSLAPVIVVVVLAPRSCKETILERRAAASLARQTGEEVFVVVVHDGSI